MKMITSVLSVFAGLFLFLASAFLFQCPQMESGAYMNCHKANVALAVLACLVVVGGLVLLFGKSRKAALLASSLVAAVGVVSALVPGVLVQLCMMPEMTCRALLRPTALVCSVVILLSAVLRLVAEVRGKAAAK
jgi:hypothetical protein